MAEPIEQLEAMRHLGENWDGYGAAAPQAKIIDLAQEFISLLDAIEHETELSPDGSIGFLHHNKDTGKIETRKFAAGSPSVVPSGLLQELRQLLRAA